MERQGSNRFRAYTLELLVYSALIVVYVLLVLSFLDGWLKNLYDVSKTRYALVCLLLIIGQSVILDTVTGLLMRVFRGRID
jgi:hypothetical protein